MTKNSKAVPPEIPSNAKYKRIELKKLLLDPDNPRLAELGIPSGASQYELLKALWDEMAVEEVAMSIAYSGYFFLGGLTHPKKGVVSRDDRHGTADHYWSFISDMWRSLGAVMADGSHVVVRIGSRRISPDFLKRGLTGCAQFSGRRVKLVGSQVTEIKGRQTDAFRPGTTGCVVELDCHFRFAD